MAIEKKLIHFSKLSDFETQLNAGNILDYSIVFIQDAKKIWTHGQYYDCNPGGAASNSVYITPFTTDEIRRTYQGEMANIPWDYQAMMDAIRNNTMILVPYDEGFPGYSIVGACFCEDAVYFTIPTINEGAEYAIAAGIGSEYIYTSDIYYCDGRAKQDKLISGENIKTFNGESLLGEGDITTPTFLRIGDFDDEAKANFIAVANGEKSADYYICSSGVKGAPAYGIVTSLVKTGPSSSPLYVSYTFYGSPMYGTKAGELLKITTNLTIATSEITTTYEAVLDAKQDNITDLEDIREGASKGATSVQPNDISEFITVEDVATVATSGSYEDLQDKPVYITDFDVLSLNNLIATGNGTVDINSQALEEALATNKIVLVPYEISDVVSAKGYATLVGYAEDLLYFKVITECDEFIVETSRGTQGIPRQEVTLRQWSDKQDTLVSGTNIKTINGNSILGSGDIVINGGSSSGSSAYSEVSHGTSDTTFTLTPNTFHIWDEVSSLTLTLGAETSDVANEYLFQFTSGSTATTLSLPDDIKWTGGEAPTIEANKIYQISILKGLGSVMEWNNAAVILDNFISISVNTLTFEYPTASELTIDVHGRTTGMPSSHILTIPSGVSSYTASDLTTILYISSVTPSSDDKYNYTYMQS